ncbi:hypothetical protein JTB14_011660 [Gonioctena quinquepunctata]|nr:hypothetical protein JTB14_011660 [Gonioctena quinquepunctata]
MLCGYANNKLAFYSTNERTMLKLQNMNGQIEKVEADSITWSLADGVGDSDVEDGPFQLDYIPSTTLGEANVEFNWDNGRFMSLIVDDDDDAD